MTANFTKSFLNGALTKHRQETWLERQRALLPGRQHLVPQARALKEAKERMKDARAEFDNAQKAVRLFDDTKHQLRSTLPISDASEPCTHCTHKHPRWYGGDCLLKDVFEKHGTVQAALKAHDELARSQFAAALTNAYERLHYCRQIFNDVAYSGALEPVAAKKEPARAFVRACPVNECRGFLSTAWKCGVCSTWACSKCHEVKAGQQDPDHQCNPDNVASATLLAKETRPCPSCAAGIFKISGCDQMWCTSCNTGFDWKTGKRIDLNRIHNPHFFEYAANAGIRGANGAAAGGAAAAGGMDCNMNQGMRGIPGNPLMGALPFHSGEFGKAFQRAMHISDVVGARYTRLAGRESEQEHEELAVMFLMGDITEKVWKERLQRLEKRQRKYRAFQDVVRGYDLACGDVFRALASRLLGREEAVQHEAKLHEMLNEALKGVCRVYTCKMPRLSH